MSNMQRAEVPKLGLNNKTFSSPATHILAHVCLGHGDKKSILGFTNPTNNRPVVISRCPETLAVISGLLSPSLDPESVITARTH